MGTSANTPAPLTEAHSLGADATVQNIQGLRGVAALAVLAAHIKNPVSALLPQAALPAALTTAELGSSGVDLFFVISGYIICLTAVKRHHRSLDFFLARVARVSPLYLVATLVALAAKVLVKTPNPISFHSIWNGVFYLPIFDAQVYTLPPVAIGWTLSFEMWFYTVFALLLMKWKPRQVVILLPIVFAVGAVLGLFYDGSWYFPKFALNAFVLEFGLGCLVFQFQDRLSVWLSWLLLAVGLVAFFLIVPRTGYLGAHIPELSYVTTRSWLRACYWGVPTAMIAAGFVGLERRGKLTLPAALIWMGGMSYSLYLSHWITIAAAPRLFRGLAWLPVWPLTFLVAAFCILVAWATWRFIELPLTKLAQGWVKRRFHPRRAGA